MPLKVLVIKSSARIVGSYNSLLVDEFLALLQQNGGPHKIIGRDFAKDPIPVLQPDVVEAIRLPPDQLDDELRSSAALSEILIEELKSANLVVIGAPMYNWGVPASLKAWIDQVLRIGFSFGYEAGGIHSLIENKPVIIISVSGGVYDAPEKSTLDFQKPYLDKVLRVIGLEPEFVLCEGTLYGEKALNAALESSRAELAKIANRYNSLR